tara:strand:- start:1307 stop:1711 length:405 start_codon:yes stop_codon:yes gene_type:complete
MQAEIPDIRQFDDIKRQMIGPVLIPNRFDRHDDGMSRNEIEYSCHYYNENYFGQCDINHTYNVSCAKIVESYILEVDCVIDGRSLVAGTWMAKTQIDRSNTGDVIWEALLSGELAGYSPEGMVYEHQITDTGAY